MEKKKELMGCALVLGLLMIVCGIFLSGVLRILLLAVLYFALLEVVMTILFPKPPKLSKEERIKAEDQWYFERQEYGKMYDMRRVGVAMTVVGVALAFLAAFRTHDNPLWGVLGMVFSLASVALCIIHPAYFALVEDEKGKNRECHFPIVNLAVPFFAPMLFSIVGFQFHVVVADWVRVAEVMLIIGAVMGVVLRLFTVECRRNTGNWVLVLFLFCACSFGFVLSLNQMLEKEEPVVVSGVVTDYDRGGRHSSDTYEVLLDSGETVDIPVNRRSYDDGDQVELEYHSGGLGIEYYTYAD